MQTRNPDKLTSKFRFGVANHVAGRAGVERAFGVKLTSPQSVDELTDRYNKAKELLAKYSEFTVDNIRDADPDEWEALFEEHLDAHLRRTILGKALWHLQNQLRRDISNARRNPATYDDAIKQIPVADTVTTLVTAAKTLGDNALDINAALEQDPVVFQTYRDAGRKLLKLKDLLPKDLTSSGFGSNPEIYLALFVDTTKLPHLQAETTRRFGVIKPLYSDVDMDKHLQVDEALSVIRGQKGMSVVLALLATGYWPALTLDIAMTAEQVEQRAVAARNTTEVEFIDGE